MRILSTFLTLGLFSVSVAATTAAEPARCRMDCSSWPTRFFSGRTTGEGSLRVLFLPAQTLHVRSAGRLTRSGALILRQTIREDGKAPSTREWRLKQVSPGRYAGTLTDAAGPVTGEVAGNLFRLRYTMKGASRVQIQQSLELQPDGKTVLNRLSASKFGLPVGSVREKISKAR